jgi:hypothetical protein
MSAYDMMNEKKKPVYPAIDEGTYAEDVERGIVEAEKKAAEIERQAKRDRDMALIGDMAHLVSQGAAMHGGAWKIGQTQNESAKGNERLRVLREKNAAQTAAFAKERAALMEAKRKEQNAQKLARYNAEVEQYKRDLEAEKYAKEQERKDRQEARQTAESIAKINYYNNGGRRTAGDSSVNRDVYLINDDGTKKVFRHADNANNIQAAYAELPSGFKAQKEVKLYDEDDKGKPVLRIDAEGVPVTKLVENTKPTLGEMRQAIEEYNARELKKGDAVEDWTPEEDEIIDYEP